MGIDIELFFLIFIHIMRHCYHFRVFVWDTILLCERNFVINICSTCARASLYSHNNRTKVIKKNELKLKVGECL